MNNLKSEEEGSEIIESHLKIIRQDGIEDQKDFGLYAYDYNNVNNWANSTLKDMLNDLYYNNLSGDCYVAEDNVNSTLKTCDFSGIADEPIGLKNVQNIIDSDIKWNLGRTSNYADQTNGLATHWYGYERGNGTFNDDPTIWIKINDSNNKHNGVGLMYPSDYGYAVGKTVREKCLNKELYSWSNDDCVSSDWLFKNANQWVITAVSGNSQSAFGVGLDGHVKYC